MTCGKEQRQKSIAPCSTSVDCNAAATTVDSWNRQLPSSVIIICFHSVIRCLRCSQRVRNTALHHTTLDYTDKQCFLWRYEPVRRTGKSDDWLTIFCSHNKVDCSEIPIVLSNLLYHYFFIELWHILILWLAKMPNGGMPVFTLIATGWRHCWHARG